MKKALVWTATSSLELYFIFLWLFNDIQWAGNLVKFLLGFSFAFSFLTVCTPSTRKIAFEKGRSVPKEVSYFVSIVAIGLLASQAHFWLASIYTLSALFEAASLDVPPKEQ